MVVIEQGGTAEAALDAIEGMIDSMTDCGDFLIPDWFPKGETASERWQSNRIFINLPRRFSKGPKSESVSRQRASLHPGTLVKRFLQSIS